jgi:hypothetical protein
MSANIELFRITATDEQLDDLKRRSFARCAAGVKR